MRPHQGDRRRALGRANADQGTGGRASVDAEAGGLAPTRLRRADRARVFPIARDHVASTVLVADAAIGRAQDVLWQALRIVAEPGGAAAFSH